MLPFDTPKSYCSEMVKPLVRDIIEKLRRIHSCDETSAGFISPDLSDEGVGIYEKRRGKLTDSFARIREIALLIEDDEKKVADIVYRAYDLEAADIECFAAKLPPRPSVDGFIKHALYEMHRPDAGPRIWLSYAIGGAFGRWDIRFVIGGEKPPQLSDAFAAIPICPPGMLQGTNGLPAKPEDVPPDFPIRIEWNGIMVDDPEHEDDIIRRVREVLEVIWKERAEAIEKEACEILSVRELRDYFRRPGNGGFWVDHVKRYSKSRRKVPIYWYLRSAKGNYGLWLYYHRLDKDILFKALLNYVEPKIRLEEDRLKTLRGRKEAAGSSGREVKQIEKDMDRQEQFVSELRDFADKLRQAANLHLKPDLNDGVVLNIAPLWELAPWKEAKEYWEELIKGEHEWSGIGKQLREKGLAK